jgi:hypothetical protein
MRGILPEAAMKAISAFMNRPKRFICGKLKPEPNTPLLHRLEKIQTVKGGVFMRIVILKLPKMLCGLARKIFHIDD